MKTFLQLLFVLFTLTGLTMQAKAALTGDVIDHTTSAGYHSPLDTFDGAGFPAAPLAGPLIVDISTGTITAGVEYWVTYAFGNLTPPSPGGPGFVVTHDLEWVGTPGALPSVINFWALPSTVAAFGGSIFSAITVHDVDGSGGGFDVGISISDTSLLASGDMFIIQIGDPSNGPGALRPPPGANYVLVDSLFPSAPIVPVPAAVWLFLSGLIGLVGFAKRGKFKH